jgi:hypothetical protein
MPEFIRINIEKAKKIGFDSPDIDNVFDFAFLGVKGLMIDTYKICL